jgi:hypothetical protein
MSMAISEPLHFVSPRIIIYLKTQQIICSPLRNYKGEEFKVRELKIKEWFLHNKLFPSRIFFSIKKI